jgi:hypothetical protein
VNKQTRVEGEGKMKKALSVSILMIALLSMFLPQMLISAQSKTEPRLEKTGHAYLARGVVEFPIYEEQSDSGAKVYTFDLYLGPEDNGTTITIILP